MPHSGDWLRDVFNDVCEVDWRHNHFSKLNGRREVSEGDVLVALQSETSSVVGFCEVVRVSRGEVVWFTLRPVETLARPLALPALDRLLGPRRLYCALTPEQVGAIAIASGASFRPAELPDLDEQVRRSNGPPTPVRREPAARTPDWTVHEQEIALRLTDISASSVRLDVTAPNEHRTRLFDLRAEYVGSTSSAMVWVSAFVTGPRMLSRYSLHNPTWSGVLRAPWRLPLAPRVDVGAPCVLVWQLDVKPIEVGRFMTSMVRERFGLEDAGRLRVRWAEAPPAVVERRVQLARHEADRSGHNRQVLGHCAKCGRALRDPYSAAVGIGPECVKSYPEKQLRLVREVNRAAAEGKAIRLTAKPEKTWLADVTRHWAVPLDNPGQPRSV